MLEINQRDEIGILARSMNKMTANLGKMFLDIREDVDILNMSSSELSAVSRQMHQGAGPTSEQAGKGFAVVANEIKALAGETAEATRKIRAKINQSQDSTGKIVLEIQDISAVIQASEGILEVTENVSQSSMVAGEIAQDIASVTREAEDMSAGSSQVRTSAEQLSGLADKLSEMVNWFKLG